MDVCFGNPNGTEKWMNTNGLDGPFPPFYHVTDPDPNVGATSIRELYERAGDINRKYTFPILWDKHENTTVSKESSEIIQMLNSQFNEIARHPDLDLYPDHLVDDIESVTLI
jgi:glutathionyl-hydroquinone reductase